MQVTAVLTPTKEGGFVAYNPETGTTNEGEAVELYLEMFPLTTSGPPLITSFDVDAHAA